jgi:hypothetical protein
LVLLGWRVGSLAVVGRGFFIGWVVLCCKG